MKFSDISIWVIMLRLSIEIIILQCNVVSKIYLQEFGSYSPYNDKV